MNCQQAEIQTQNMKFICLFGKMSRLAEELPVNNWNCPEHDGIIDNKNNRYTQN